MEDRNNKTCSELIRDELKERIAGLKQVLKSEDVIDQIVYYSLEIMEKILENTQE